MKRFVNIQLSSRNAIAGSYPNSSQYNVNFRNLLKPDKAYKLHWNYIGGRNTVKLEGFSNYIASVYADFNTNTFAAGPNGATNTQCIGFLKPIILQGAQTTAYFQSEDNTNLPIYLENAPNNSILTIRVLDQAGNLYLDETAAFNGTGSTAANVLTITAVTTGYISVGTYLTLSVVNFYVTSQLTGTPGGVGTYAITYASTLVSGAVTSTTGNPNAPYLLNMRFEEIDD